MNTQEKPRITQSRTDRPGEAAKAQARLKRKQAKAAVIMLLPFCAAMYFIFGSSDAEKWAQTGLN